MKYIFVILSVFCVWGQTPLSSPTTILQPPQGGVGSQLVFQDGNATPRQITFSSPAALTVALGYNVVLPDTAPTNAGQVMSVSSIAGQNITMDWSSGTSGCAVGGIDTSIVYNKTGACFGDANLRWQYNTNTLRVNGDVLPLNDNGGNLGLSTQGWTRVLSYEIDLAAQGAHSSVWRLFATGVGVNSMLLNDPAGTTVLQLAEGGTPQYDWTVKGSFHPPFGFGNDYDLGCPPLGPFPSICSFRNGWFYGTVNSSTGFGISSITDSSVTPLFTNQGLGTVRGITICPNSLGAGWCPTANPTIPFVLQYFTHQTAIQMGQNPTPSLSMFLASGVKVAWMDTANVFGTPGEVVVADGTGAVRASIDGVNGVFTNLGYHAGAATGLTHGATVAAPGGGTCTLTFTLGIYSGGTC